MSTFMDRLRDLNQQSIGLDEQWLSRLRFVGSGSGLDSSLPEIVLPTIQQPEQEPAAEPTSSLATEVRRNDARQCETEPSPDHSGQKGTLPSFVDADAQALFSVPAPFTNVSSVSSSTDSAYADIEPNLVPPKEPSSEPENPEAPLEVLNELVQPGRDRHRREASEVDEVSGSQDVQHGTKGETKTRVSSETQQLVMRIVDRFPSVGPATIILVSIDNSLTTNKLATDIATCLASADGESGSVLLVDADSRKRALSDAYGSLHLMGVTDIINRNEPVHSLVRDTDCQGLSFLPCGSGDITHRKMDWTRISRMTLGLSHRFRYTIISGGHVGELLTDCWAAYVDGVYLVLGDQSTDRDHAQEAVAHLRSLGARMLGCILMQQSTSDEPTAP